MSLPRVRVAFFGDEDMVPLSKRIELVYALEETADVTKLLPMERLIAEIVQAEDFVNKFLKKSIDEDEGKSTVFCYLKM